MNYNLLESVNKIMLRNILKFTTTPFMLFSVTYVIMSYTLFWDVC